MKLAAVVVVMSSFLPGAVLVVELLVLGQTWTAQQLLWPTEAVKAVAGSQEARVRTGCLLQSWCVPRQIS